MNSRRTALRIGSTGVGMLAAAFLSSGVAYAAPDVPTPDPFGLSPIGTEDVVPGSFWGLPPVFQQVGGTESFDVIGTPTGATSPEIEGTLSAVVTNIETDMGFHGEEVTVSGIEPSAADPTATLPGVGSVFEIYNLDGFTNFYSDVVSGTGASLTQTVTDDLLTPFSNTPIDLSSMFGDFDLAAIGADVSSLF